MASWRSSASSRSSWSMSERIISLELLALLGRQLSMQRLHLRHLPAHLLDELIEAFDAREAVAPLLLEGLEVRLLALGLLAQHAVEVLHHLRMP